MRRHPLVFVLLAALLPADAKQSAKASSVQTVSSTGGTGSNPTSKTSGTAGHHGPYEEFANGIGDKKKKKSFFDLIKRLKQGACWSLSAASAGTRDGTTSRAFSPS
jgi:hypothetical protein